MAEDSKGRIWAISEESLFRFDAPNWTRVDISMAKLGHHLEDLAIDKSGGLWINGNGRGAARFQLQNGNDRGLYACRICRPTKWCSCGWIAGAGFGLARTTGLSFLTDGPGGGTRRATG